MFIERNELEKIFSNSVEEVKKQILKRRIKTEATLNSKSKPMHLDYNNPNVDNSQRFEDAMLKLVSFAKNKIKYHDFTAADKYHLIELFVTNETTLLYLYRSLFQQDEKND